MTDDELSELEECMVDACREAAASGVRITSGTFGFLEPGTCCCPVTVMAGAYRCGTVVSTFDELTGTYGNAWSFANGFDLSDPPLNAYQPELYAMGRRMRERLEAGEFNRC